MKEKGRIYPVRALKLPNGNTLIDFGMNFAGTYIYGNFARTHTTLPESWSGRYSQNHAMLGVGDSFFFERLAGIKNVGIAFDKVEVNPYFPDDINRFSLKMKTPKGQINIRWERKDKVIFTCEHSSKIEIAFDKNKENVIFKEKVLFLD